VALPYLLAQFYDRHVRLFHDLCKDEIGASLELLRSAVAAIFKGGTSPLDSTRFAQRTAVARPISNRAAA
jgi:hypothetical protein